jgi:lipopolysaccharide/colanic/teichoic acid biosynthesis glycosyltransferase
VKIAVSGASGSVGRNLIPLLVQAGHTLLLISRDPAKVADQFPGLAVASSVGWEEDARDYDIFLHLAVRNNNQAGSLGEFMEANANLTSTLAEGARRAGISRFVYPSTVQALMPEASSPYVLSKIAGMEAAHMSFPGAVDVVYLGLVHGHHYSGKLSFLNKLPRSFGSFLFSLFSALKPTTSVQRLVRYLSLPRPAGADHSSILSDPKSQNPTYRFWRASLGGVFVLAVSLLSPLLFVVWAIIVIEGGRPGIFTQERRGRGNTVFNCVKFRTMRNGTGSKGSHMVDSDAVTKVGRILRRLKVDELPQAWNIARGEMALIGPRPCLPNQEEVIAARQSREVVNYSPGLTGWAQVNGVDMSEPEMLATYDSQYLGLQSVSFDLKIIRGTLIPIHRPPSGERQHFG